MPLPLILGAAAAFAAAGGVGSGIHGAVKMKEANNTMKEADQRHRKNIARFEAKSELTNSSMDDLGKLELEILKSLKEFSDTIEKIQNRPEFKEYNIEGVKIPKYDKEELNKASVGAGVLLGGLGGAAAGAAGGFAAAGATTSAVMALGTASTGTAIASLSGAAATNATLAALGGGAVATGGGGIALGTSILGATTLGVGLLVGGVIFNITGSKLSDKADEAWSQMKKAEESINEICDYLDQLNDAAIRYKEVLSDVNEKYKEEFTYVSYFVNELDETDYERLIDLQKESIETTVLLVTLLYNMCKVKLVNREENDKGMNSVNHADINQSIEIALNTMSNIDKNNI